VSSNHEENVSGRELIEDMTIFHFCCSRKNSEDRKSSLKGRRGHRLGYKYFLKYLFGTLCDL